LRKSPMSWALLKEKTDPTWAQLRGITQ